MSEIPGDWADAQGTFDVLLELESNYPPAPHESCAWCGIKAGAVPDEPPLWWEGAWYHRRGCYEAVRLVAAGALPADYLPVEQWGAAS